MVERDSQKGIIIGKKGSMLKKIGQLARRDIEIMLGDKVFLETWVKVKKNWRDKKLDLADFGYNKKEYWKGPVDLFNPSLSIRKRG